MKTFHDGKITLHAGDCLDVLKAMPENSVDAVVTDPPYHLTSITKQLSKNGYSKSNLEQPADKNLDGIMAGSFRRLTKGFMGKQWDGGDIAFRPDLWAEVLRVLKPGGHMVAFSGCRTYHRMACAIEDAGFEIREMLAWVFGQGFPKSHDVSKGIDRAAGAEREILGTVDPRSSFDGRERASAAINTDWRSAEGRSDVRDLSKKTVTAPATDAACQWEGWGSALKPSFEPLCFAQKPLNYRQNCDIIGSSLIQLWSRLWLMLSVKDAAQLSTLSPSAYGVDVSASAQWSAADASNTRAALSGQMDTSLFELALISSLNTVSSWSLTWAESSEQENTSITETELNTTIDLRTLKSSVSKITPEGIILAHRSGAWLNASASPAERYLSAAVTRLSAILELSAAENALSLERISSPEETGQIKPNLSPICLARKPLDSSTIAGNVLRWGTGALNIDGCRIPGTKPLLHAISSNKRNNPILHTKSATNTGELSMEGRWPANLCHDGSPEVLAGFPASSSSPYPQHLPSGALHDGGIKTRSAGGFSDSGSAARFFYTAKADADDRIGSKHPTVKPVDLMQWLVRLICPKGATVLDPFAGTGTTGAAAFIEGRWCVLIERESEYLADIEKRMELLLSGSDERSWKLAKPEPLEALPLFALTKPAA